MNRMHVRWLAGAVLVISTAGVVHAIDWVCPYCHQTFHFDPRDTAYMESWKQMHISQVHSGSPGGAATMPFGGANPFDSLFQPIGQALANALFGNPQQQAIDEAHVRQRRAQQAAAARLEEERAAREAQLAAEQRQREFAESKARILGQMKGVDGRTFDGTAAETTELRVKEVGDIFGTRAVKPAGTSEAAGSLQLKTIDFTPNVPPVGPEVETRASIADREQMKQKILAYQALLDRGQRQLADFHAAETQVKAAETRLAAAREAVSEARQKKAALETTPPAPGAPPAPDLDDALAALAKAEQATADADRALAEAKGRQSNIETQMRETLQTLAQTPRPPGWVDQAPSTPAPPATMPPDR
jgi:exonuclease VII small subunit